MATATTSTLTFWLFASILSIALARDYTLTSPRLTQSILESAAVAASNPPSSAQFEKSDMLGKQDSGSGNGPAVIDSGDQPLSVYGMKQHQATTIVGSQQASKPTSGASLVKPSPGLHMFFSANGTPATGSFLQQPMASASAASAAGAVNAANAANAFNAVNYGYHPAPVPQFVLPNPTCSPANDQPGNFAAAATATGDVHGRPSSAYGQSVVQTLATDAGKRSPLVGSSQLGQPNPYGQSPYGFYYQAPSPTIPIGSRIMPGCPYPYTQCFHFSK